MAPRETPKATVKAPRATTVKPNTLKPKASPAAVKNVISRNIAEKTPLSVNNKTTEVRHRTATVPKVSTPKPKENKSVPAPNTVTKSAKKPSWKRRPKPAHSGVPVPKMMKLKQLLQEDCDL